MVDKVLIAKSEKPKHKGALHGIISNGGVFSIGPYEIEFAALNDTFTQVQIYHKGIDSNPTKQRWVKTKKVVEKPKETKKEAQKKLQEQFKEEYKTKVSEVEYE